MHVRQQMLVIGLSIGAWQCTKQKVDLPEKTSPSAVQAQATATPAAAAESALPEPVAASSSEPANGAAKTAQEGQSARLSGEVASQIKSQISFRVGGFIQELKAKTGVACKKGDVLATLDVRDYKLSSDLARSQKELAKVALNNAQSEFKREQELKAENASTEANFDRVKAAFDKAKLDLQMAELRQLQADQALSDTKLVAPYDCVVTKQLRNVGESVKPGDAVFELYNTSDIELTFAVPERLAGKVKVGDKIKISIPATGYQGDVEIVRLVPVVDQASRTFRIIAKAPEQDGRVIPGLYAEAQIK